MQPITLTEEHKTKLLEMCKTLFSEYDYFKLKEDNVCGLTQQLIDFENRDWFDNHNESEKWNIENYENWEFTIHWFEFCLTYLPIELYRYAMHKCKTHPVIALKIIETNLNRFIDFGRYKINPIDYLYEEFLKLKV